MIIGITGTIGAGKGTVVDYLVATRGFAHFSARDFLAEEIKKRNLPMNRDSFNAVGEDLRAMHGASYVVDELCKCALAHGGDGVIESLRTTGEVDSLKAKGVRIIAVDADPKIRYARIVLRKSVTDNVSYEKFLADEDRESHSEDPARMNLPKCMARADVVFHNDGDLDALHQQIDRLLAAR